MKNVYPISFYWIDQNEPIAAAMGWRWLQAVGKRCVAQQRTAYQDSYMSHDFRHFYDTFSAVSGYGIWDAQMQWLEPYTYPNSIDVAPIRRSFGEVLPPQPSVTLHCALIHALVGYPAADIDELDAWNMTLIKTGEGMNEAVYPHAGDESGSYWPSTFATWKYSAYRAIREWQFQHSRLLPQEAWQRKILP